MKVGIIGGGIGGAALAVSLLQQGIDVTLFERAPQFGEVGAGIQMTPNAVKAITALGLRDKIEHKGFFPHAVRGRNWRTGRENFRIDLGAEFQDFYQAPFIHIHRADLHDLFASEIPPEICHFNKSCTGVANTQDGATATFDDGTTFTADVIVGADGVRSVVRSDLFGSEDPKFTGHMCFRALVETGRVVDYAEPMSTFWMGPNAHVVTYYVKGGKAVNIVAVCETERWVDESWSTRATKEELLAAFPGWHPNLQKLFSNVSEVYRWGLFDRDPMPSWSKGNITLLGDAAHPMLPFLSQGAAMAIEDALVLGVALGGKQSVPEALAAYEAERRPRTSRVQLEARERGRTYHLPTLGQQLRRDMGYFMRTLFSPRSTGIKADWVYEYDPRLFGN